MHHRAILAVLLLLSTAAAAAPPTTPASLPYQALLLDGLGEPRTGSVDLTLRIWDAIAGGTLVYKQSFAAVPLADGVFTVQLGPTGEGADAPDDPLTTSLAAALAGDVGPTAPVRFLEVTVGGDGALARTQILSSAYAVRAASAATADTAENATGVGGFAAEYVTQFLTYSLADGADPPNTDPSEGLADVDGDGIANFVDPDNDGDGLGDAIELSRGSDINLVTPTIAAIAPASGSDQTPTPVTVTGTNFESGLVFTIGAQTPAVANVTPTSFEAVVGPQAAGTVGIDVALPNGESDALANAFTFVTPPPDTLPGWAHTVTLGSGSSVAAGYDLAVRPGTIEVALAGFKEYAIGDPTTGLAEHALASRGAIGQIAVAFDATGRLGGLRCRDTGSGCVVEVLTDLDGDGALEDETGVSIETLNGTATLESAQLDRNPSGGWAAAYVKRAFSASAVVANDRNGDGDFADAGETLVLGSAVAQVAAASGQPIAVAFASELRLDENADGDFADPGERVLLGSSLSTSGDLVLNGVDRVIAVAGSNLYVGDAVLP